MRLDKSAVNLIEDGYDLGIRIGAAPDSALLHTDLLKEICGPKPLGS